MGKPTVAILTGGGDVPGLNPAIRAITIRAIRDGYRVLGIRRGWGGLVDFNAEADAGTDDCVIELTEDRVDRAGRTGGTFLHTSRTNPQKLPDTALPPHLADKYHGSSFGLGKRAFIGPKKVYVRVPSSRSDTKMSSDSKL